MTASTIKRLLRNSSFWAPMDSFDALTGKAANRAISAFSFKDADEFTLSSVISR
jgi:hypothetical protein